MSKFFKALEQAERDHALGDRAAMPRLEALPTPTAPTVPTVPTRPPDPAGRATSPRSSEVPTCIDEHLVSLLMPASFEGEQYRTLAHLVEQAHRREQVSVVAVSAPGVSDGKTTTAINLAGALAQIPGTRVLLIDGDLRRPSVAKRLGLDPRGHPGLLQALRDPALGVADIAMACPPFNLSAIIAGGGMASPHELLRTDRVERVIAEARHQFDFVVLDTPPLVSVADCRILAKCLDAFLVVVTAHQTSRTLLSEALGVLQSVRVLGLVFNGDDHWLDGSYYRSMRGYGHAQFESQGGNDVDDVAGLGRRRSRRSSGIAG
jgi:capsular exopolysaccharide synthesis family protein